MDLETLADRVSQAAANLQGMTRRFPTIAAAHAELTAIVDELRGTNTPAAKPSKPKPMTRSGRGKAAKP